jgi:hypothetical protein
MTDQHSDPEIAQALENWLAARADTDQFLNPLTRPIITDTWAQGLADLLAIERGWEEQYTALIGGDMRDGFPPPSI